jgi:hypothetical protein
VDYLYPQQTLTHAFQLAWGREPTPPELDRAMAFTCVRDSVDKTTIDQQRLVDFCHVLINASEFLYLD